MTSSFKGNAENPRSALGGLVGKVYEGGVEIYGTESRASNTDLSVYSTVSFKSFKFAETDEAYNVCVGGLVGYTGHGCKAYDMHVVAYDDSDITIGGTVTSKYVGGLVGAMSSFDDSTNDTSCEAEFKNCTLEKINIEGEFAGGLYGGKWDYQNYCPYKVEIENCSVKGDSSTDNTITAVTYAGGLISRGYVKTGVDNEYITQMPAI